jgi:ABC-type polysaccharide/polyol phosphate transport system ATPase subunit
MSENAIVVENLSKRYLIGHRSSSDGAYKYTALRDEIGREIRNFARKAADVFRGRQIVQGDEVEEFWALRDVSFEVKQGEAIGIIGRNGAGKSTLLKILSRITEPTKGRVALHGRVSSLLEVGTGFHPELTGRENIYLNGAILGMMQKEIRRKFDEIVDFAEVEKFLDTPVKHYSSGMYVRLAFAVAAHLEPEILIVDEVLAVGDAEFQKKCLGKMDEVSRSQGRTVLFVSHNMEAVLKLCSTGIFLEAGSIRVAGDVKSIVSAYLRSQSSSPRVVEFSKKPRMGNPMTKAQLVSASPSDAESTWSIPFGKPLSLDLSVDIQPSVSKVELVIAVFSTRGFEVATWSDTCGGADLPVRPGINTYRVKFQHMRLLPGQYYLSIGLGSGRGFDNADWIPEAVLFEVVPSVESAAMNVDFFGGAFVPTVDISLLD